MMNSSDTRNDGVQNFSVAENLLREEQFGSSSRREKYYGIEREAKQQRNIGSPITIDTLAENLSVLSVPRILRKRDGRIGSSLNVAGRESCVVVGESQSYIDNGHKSRKNGVKVTPSRTNRRPCKDKCQSFEESEERASPENGETNDPSKESSMRDNIDDDYDEECLVRVYPLKSNVVVLMSQKARFSFTGKLRVRTMYGAVQAYGHIVTKESGAVEMYSPRGYGNVSVEACENVSTNFDTDIWLDLSAECIHRELDGKLTAAIDRIQPGMAVLVLWNLENKLTKFLGTFSPFALFPRIKTVPHYTSIDSRKAEMILQSNLYIDNRHTSVCNDKHMDLIHDPRIAKETKEKMLSRWRRKEWSCALVAGGKSVGKSTAVRYLTNSLLSEECRFVVLLDLDLGQSECAPPGCISYSEIRFPLIGPNFTHLKAPDFQLYIGHVNVVRCVSRYIEGVRILMDKLRKSPRLSRLPIVVNTMGFTHDIGWHIMLSVTKLIRPSHVIQIVSENPKKNYMEDLSKEVVNRQELPWTLPTVDASDECPRSDHELLVVRSLSERKNVPSHGTWNMTPYQQRQLVTISYFSEVLRKPINSAQLYDAAALSMNDASCYAAPLASLWISIPRVGVPATHVLNVINGNIVALGGIDVEDEPTESETVRGLRVLDTLPLCTCYGFGIVRGVDVEREEIFISTPLPVSTMRYVNCLMGCIPVPVGLLRSNDTVRKNVPYTGGNDILPMGRKHRRGYFRMRYKKVQNATFDATTNR